jgi:protein phosphatase 1 regulatory subunit 11
LYIKRDEATLDNEGLGRKSSKRCCIFHKQRAFDESSTDSSQYDSDRDGSNSSNSSSNNSGSKKASGASDGGDRKMPAAKAKNGGPKIARRKKGKRKIPESQRFHA